MAEGSPADGETGRSGWHALALALVGGLAVASFMFFLIAAVRTPGLDPPPESAALFVVATTAAVISYLLLEGRHPAGYPVAMLAGGLVLVVLGVILVGTYGSAGPRTNPAGPLSYGALAVAVVVAAGAAWRKGTAAVDSSAA